MGVIARIQAQIVHNKDRSVRKGRTLIWLMEDTDAEVRAQKERYMILMETGDHSLFHASLQLKESQE